MTVLHALWSAITTPLAPVDKEAITAPLRPVDKENEESGYFEFRPLTQKEKKEFIDSLDAEGRQILADLRGKRITRSPTIDRIEPAGIAAPPYVLQRTVPGRPPYA